jgi:cellobiose-specific phosphotransferase system component IIC
MAVATLRTRSKPSALRALFISGRWVQYFVGLILAVFSVAMFYPFVWLISCRNSGR